MSATGREPRIARGSDASGTVSKRMANAGGGGAGVGKAAGTVRC